MDSIMPPPSTKLSFSPTTQTVVHWFRRDLRLHDNPALNRAISLCNQYKRPLIPLFLLDPDIHSVDKAGPVRLRFLLESLTALQAALQASCNAHLRILTARPVDLLPSLTRRWRVSHLTFEREYSPFEVTRDSGVSADLAALGLSIIPNHGFTLYEPDALLRAALSGAPPRTMSAFLALVRRVGDPPQPTALAPDAAALLPCPDALLHGDERDGYLSVPSVLDMGFSEVELAECARGESFPGGEAAGMARMDEFLSREGGSVAACFEKPDTSPAALHPRETTVLSPYLALGCVSCREFHGRLTELESRFKVAAMPQTRLWGQLMWREHFWLLAGAVPEFHRMEGNPLCRKIPWREDEDKDRFLLAWREARTGYPWIDALMTQLRTEGFVHHLGRHSLACFLTRGDMWVSWEEGYKVFEYYLVDYDYALNSANWMWLSCSAFFAMYFRVYSPVAFAKKWDKDGEFVKHYLPVLRNLPAKYTHEPWKAPLSVQREAGCVVGADYPKRIVDHALVRKENIEKMKEAYGRNEYGASGQSQIRDTRKGRGAESSVKNGKRRRTK